MKYTTTLFTTLILFSAFTQVVSAQSPTPSTRQQNRQEIREIREEQQENLIQTLQEVRSTRGDARSLRLNGHCERVQHRLQTVLGKLESITADQQQDGKNVSVAESEALKAKNALTEAATLCQQASLKYTNIPVDELEVQKTAVTEAKNLAQQARAKFVEARKALSSMIPVLRNNAKKNTVEN